MWEMCFTTLYNFPHFRQLKKEHVRLQARCVRAVLIHATLIQYFKQARQHEVGDE